VWQRERQRTRDRKHIVGTSMRTHEERESKSERARERESERAKERERESERARERERERGKEREREREGEREREPVVSLLWARKKRERERTHRRSCVDTIPQRMRG